MNYTKIYNSLIEKAKTRTVDGYHEAHHIVPRCIGGDDSKENLVLLTPEEHYIAHQLLHKMYPDHPGLLYAAVKMCQNRPTNKLYGWLRRRLSQSQSDKMAGNGNTMYGKRWVSNEKETILLEEQEANEYINSGKWIPGKKAKIAPCGHLVRSRCLACEKLPEKRKLRCRAAGKKLAEDLYNEFKNSQATSITEFAKMKNTSQPRLSMLWKKYIPEYIEAVQQGKKYQK